MGYGLPLTERKKLTKLHWQIKLESKDPADKWEMSLLGNKSFLHNLYLNVISNKYGAVGDFDLKTMVESSYSAFSPMQKERLNRMINEIGFNKSSGLINSFFKIYKGVLKTRYFRIDEEYLEIKRSIYFKNHKNLIFKKMRRDDETIKG